MQRLNRAIQWFARTALPPLAQLTVVLVGVSFLTFLMLNLLPGDPAFAVLGENATPEAVARFTSEHQLDRSIVLRYFDWFGGVLKGDFGTSYVSDRKVLPMIMDRVAVSVELVIFSQILALALAIPTALLSVLNRGGLVDRALSMVAFAGLSVPSFLLSFILILVFAVKLQWLPASGFAHLDEGLLENLRTAILPSIALAASQFAVYTRLLRNEMLDTLSYEYITTAHGKGLSRSRILIRHVMRNSLLPLVTVVGVGTGILLGGAVITETVFAIPGVGRLLIDSIGSRDLAVVQGVVLFIALCYVIINLLVDVLYTVLDPRITYGPRD